MAITGRVPLLLLLGLVAVLLRPGASTVLLWLLVVAVLVGAEGAIGVGEGERAVPAAGELAEQRERAGILGHRSAREQGSHQSS